MIKFGSTRLKRKSSVQQVLTIWTGWYIIKILKIKPKSLSNLLISSLSSQRLKRLLNLTKSNPLLNQSVTNNLNESKCVATRNNDGVSIH